MIALSLKQGGVNMLMLLRDYRRGIEQNDKSFVGLANT